MRRVPDDVLLGAAAQADGVNGFVFGEDQRVADFFRDAAGNEFILRAPSCFVAGAAPVEGRDGGRGGGWHGS